MAFLQKNHRGPYNTYLETEAPLANLPQRTRWYHSKRLLSGILIEHAM